MSTSVNESVVDNAVDSKIYKFADSDGVLRRAPAVFRDSISTDPSARFTAEPGRYALYINRGCPWCHRVNIVYHLKGLQDVIKLVVMSSELTPNGWHYNGSDSEDGLGRDGSMPADPIHGFKWHKQLYELADPTYTGRYTVPVLWDTRHNTVVSNESSDILRMLYSSFDAFLPDKSRTEALRPLLPSALKPQIEEMNEWVYEWLNNGVYRAGMASSEDAYKEAFWQVFQALDRLEEHLETQQQNGNSPFLFGQHVTEADIRLYVSLVRFDVAYFNMFKLNLRMIRWEYPRLHTYLRKLYFDEGPETNEGVFRKTTDFFSIKMGYAKTLKIYPTPIGPEHDIMPLEIMPL